MQSSNTSIKDAIVLGFISFILDCFITSLFSENIHICQIASNGLLFPIKSGQGIFAHLLILNLFAGIERQQITLQHVTAAFGELRIAVDIIERQADIYAGAIGCRKHAFVFTPVIQ